MRDLRDLRFTTHLLGDLLTSALCATLSGAKSFEDLVAFGRSKEAWLRTLGLTLPEGIPSHDTFRDLFRHLDPAVFQDCFTAWINAVCAHLGVQQVQAVKYFPLSRASAITSWPSLVYDARREALQ